MYKTISTLGAIAAFAATATAHGLTTGVTIDGVFSGGYKLDYYYQKQNGAKSPDHIGWAAQNLDTGFIEPNAFGTADIICHKAGSPEGSSDSMAKVAAGGTVQFHWTAWPDSHVGPVITYVAPYTGNIASVDKTSLKWTKIQEDGYDNGWAAIKMIKQNNTWPVTVPSSLAAGKYVFRHEIIALHSAYSANGAQAYPQCLNIEVTGSGTTKPEGVVGTKLYTANEDGILFDPYTPTIKYKIPGPALFGKGSGSPTTPTTPPSGSVSAKPSPAASAKPASSVPAPKPASSAAPAPKPASSAAPAASAKPAPSTGSGGNNSGNLPAEFTIKTFIAWLESKAANGKARRHSRSFE
ncbi:glycosyl hydrolase family 61-domain-containing protein [Phaeosphaeriaceae sp. PMI808]|nr:glycosyl hydrolase family 61-domain-containing protein [Phaeosphaeriaceae sp. PMI808]